MQTSENKMTKLLFINACMSEHSRTEALTRRYLAGKHYEITELRLEPMDLQPLDRAAVEERSRDIQNGNLSGEAYALARQFAEAEEILIAAPYWDASFPAKLKIYLERISVPGVTFAYDAEGNTVKKCRANRLVYITTSGGFLRPQPGIKLHIEELCAAYGIEESRFFAAEGLDIYPDKVDAILEETLKTMERY